MTTRPQPTDGDTYRAYALIENALANGFHDAGLFVLLSRRIALAEMVWNQLTAGERRPRPELTGRPQLADVGPCSARMPSLLLGQANLMCELRHGHTGDHLDGPTRWGERDTEQPHHYLSTACLHGHHNDCDIDTRRYDGTWKTAATCKYCPAPCVCPHHTEASNRPHPTCIDATNLRAGKPPGSEWVCGPDCPRTGEHTEGHQ